MLLYIFSNMAEDFSLQFLSTSLLLILPLLVLLFNFFDNTEIIFFNFFLPSYFTFFFGSALDSHFFIYALYSSYFKLSYNVWRSFMSMYGRRNKEYEEEVLNW